MNSGFVQSRDHQRGISGLKRRLYGSALNLSTKLSLVGLWLGTGKTIVGNAYRKKQSHCVTTCGWKTYN